MAALDRQIRPSNKEPDWSSLCNNVFDQYLDTDDVFGFGREHRERSSSHDSMNIFDSSAGSEQSHQTTGTSPIPAWSHNDKHRTLRNVDTQPKAQAPPDFWTKTLRALEKNAADSEKKHHKLRSTKSHPDFLSLGGFPSPPAIPRSPTDQSLSVRRQRSRVFGGDAANGRKQNQARSVSRGRPSGVVKTAPIPPNPYATVRKTSTSPHKMMNPSRYRAGFKDIWADRATTSPNKKWDISIPPNHMFMAPPPSSAPFPQSGDFTNVFGSPTAKYSSMPAYDEQLSPLTTTFQHAHIHTPGTSPAVRQNAAAHAANAFFSDIPPVPPISYTQTVPLNDTAPLFPERTSSLAPGGLEQFDFGFSTADDHIPSPTENPWNISSYTTNHPPTTTEDDPFASLNSPIFPSIEPDSNTLDMTAGLGISYTPMHLSATTPFYPTTPHRSHFNRDDSTSPTPIPQTEPRSRRRDDPTTTPRSRRSTSRHHRRTKSAGPPTAGFVNYTPQDSSKILNGVAPSGSSKTKARREKEAADRRRKLSQAALKAVVDAGGSIEGLTEAGLMF